MRPPNFAEFVGFMSARHQVYIDQKVKRLPPPWTDDPVLAQYRFCNVYRELDTVTIWVREHIREPYADHANLWFMLAMARQINHPGTLEELMTDRKGGWPTAKLGAWKPERARQIMNARKARGEQVYTGAYMLTNVLDKNDDSCPHDKPYFTCHKVLAGLIPHALSVNVAALVSMEDVHKELRAAFGFGGFLAYEVACDMRWTRYGLHWKDVNTFAHAGPGALRGLNRLDGLHKDTPRKEAAALTDMRALLAETRKAWPRKSTLWPTLELREIEHSLCEYDKWKRTHNGEGRPRSKYTPSST